MTELELFNITLSMFDKELTQSDIDSVTPSKEVRLCIRYKEIAIVRAMREFDWSFLIIPLVMDYTPLDVDHFGFDYSYTLPTGVLKVVHNFTDYPYEVKRGILHTDTFEPVVYGIMEDLPEDGIPLDFYELIAMSLAYQIAPMIVPDGKLDKVIFQKYTWALNSLISAECHNNSREA
jgi:hypothetical protein